eukprot:TRINITY_DN972_c1_g1_i2.p4 TRINITY_DN972_c1_g1~~TRINITY_DN972_c1_g1_i2.p4  ORF type:complete len:180 (-),score=5.10 TRINITY_DN972_c1_g1_i2:303-842(-)
MEKYTPELKHRIKLHVIMGCYMGTATPANRVRWTLFFLFLVTGCIFVGLYLYKKTTCPEEYVACVDNLYYEDKIGPVDRLAARKVEMEDFKYHSLSNSQEVQVCLAELNECSHTAMIYVVVFVCLFVVSSIPIFVMLCCAERPYDFYDDIYGYSPLDSVVQMQSMRSQQQAQYRYQQFN